MPIVLASLRIWTYAGRPLGPLCDTLHAYDASQAGCVRDRAGDPPSRRWWPSMAAVPRGPKAASPGSPCCLPPGARPRTLSGSSRPGRSWSSPVVWGATCSSRASSPQDPVQPLKPVPEYRGRSWEGPTLDETSIASTTDAHRWGCTTSTSGADAFVGGARAADGPSRPNRPT